MLEKRSTSMASMSSKEGEGAEPHAYSSASSRKIGCIQAGASLKSFTSSRRLSAGSVRFGCSRRSGVMCSSPSSRSACIRRPLKRRRQFPAIMTCMPRAARASQGGYRYHVLNRGNGRRTVYHKDGDYAAFLRLVTEAAERTPLHLLAYCLMPNHFHLALWPQGDRDLSDYMMWLLTRTSPLSSALPFERACLAGPLSCLPHPGGRSSADAAALHRA